LGGKGRQLKKNASPKQGGNPGRHPRGNKCLLTIKKTWARGERPREKESKFWGEERGCFRFGGKRGGENISRKKRKGTSDTFTRGEGKSQNVAKKLGVAQKNWLTRSVKKPTLTKERSNNKKKKKREIND